MDLDTSVAILGSYSPEGRAKSGLDAKFGDEIAAEYPAKPLVTRTRTRDLVSLCLALPASYR